MLQLSTPQAQKLALHAQGLLTTDFPKGKAGISAVFDQVGYVQLDTISVIERAHHHTLWTRLPDYTATHLHELQAEDRHIFEYWSHAAALLPISDYRYCLPRMHYYASGKSHWFKSEPETLAYVYDRIRAEGPLMVRDFKTPQQNSQPWWGWTPIKKALENHFMAGKLMVTERRKFHKVYDLTQRVLPTHIDTSVPTDAEMSRYLIERTLKAHGLASIAAMTYLRRGVKSSVKKALQKMVDIQEIVAVQVEGVEKQTYYTTPSLLQTIDELPHSQAVHLLSPFDNVAIQRKRLSQLFGFDYTIECYVPKAKRVYGYFSLPILWGNRMVARLDAKAERKSRTFYLRNFVFEPYFAAFEAFLPVFVKKIDAFARFNGCDSIVVEQVRPKPYGLLLKKAFL